MNVLELFDDSHSYTGETGDGQPFYSYDFLESDRDTVRAALQAYVDK